ncbi:hypothetical protein AC18_4681 [Escherichia coli 2-222-05_S3_C2]|nr:hypothetical protein ECDEC5E_3685 [Escherichia coli DEC5E]KEN84891.1 hypothetical protein AB88_4864 [Escherichia coli 2-222-05_S3_C1]KEN93761.1 hypothetical protein AC18_4681 [Escherichia coli 2-222-05_S3_C2]
MCRDAKAHRESLNPHRVKQHRTRSRSPRDVVPYSRSPECEERLKSDMGVQ